MRTKAEMVKLSTVAALDALTEEVEGRVGKELDGAATKDTREIIKAMCMALISSSRLEDLQVIYDRRDLKKMHRVALRGTLVKAMDRMDFSHLVAFQAELVAMLSEEFAHEKTHFKPSLEFVGASVEVVPQRYLKILEVEEAKSAAC